MFLSNTVLREDSANILMSIRKLSTIKCIQKNNNNSVLIHHRRTKLKKKRNSILFYNHLTLVSFCCYSGSNRQFTHTLRSHKTKNAVLDLNRASRELLRSLSLGRSRPPALSPTCSSSPLCWRETVRTERVMWARTGWRWRWWRRMRMRRSCRREGTLRSSSSSSPWRPDPASGTGTAAAPASTSNAWTAGTVQSDPEPAGPAPGAPRRRGPRCTPGWCCRCSPAGCTWRTRRWAPSQWSAADAPSRAAFSSWRRRMRRRTRSIWSSFHRRASAARVGITPASSPGRRPEWRAEAGRCSTRRTTTCGPRGRSAPGRRCCLGARQTARGHKCPL